MITKLQKICKIVLELEDKTYKRPLDYAAFTPPQLRFLQCTDKYYILRGGNQIGKSFCGAAEVIYRCSSHPTDRSRSLHPYKKTKAPPISVWIVCHSWSQSVEMQERVWNLVAKDDLEEGTEYVGGKGFRGAGTPVVRWKNGSVVKFKTTQQTGGGKGTVALASGSVDFILVDEPPPAAVWSELVARTLRKRGSAVACTFTPVGVPVGYLKDMVDKGMVTDIHAPLTVENVQPVGCSRSLLSAEEIDSISQSYLNFDRNCRMEGSWEGFTPDGIVFEHFRDELISDVDPRRSRDLQKGQWKLSVGIDHGSAAGSEFAVLVAIWIPADNTVKPYIYIMDEYYSGAATAEVHARGILAMLRRNRLDHKMIDRWTGDRSHRGDKYGGRMSNTMLRAGFEHVLNYPRGRGFYIHTAYKPAYSVYYGARVLSELQGLNRFQVHPRCDKLIKSFKNWAILKNGRLDSLSEHKHALDACRYATMATIDPTYRAPRNSKLQIIR